MKKCKKVGIKIGYFFVIFIRFCPCILINFMVKF